VVKLLVGGRGEISAKHKLIFKYKKYLVDDAGICVVHDLMLALFYNPVPLFGFSLRNKKPLCQITIDGLEKIFISLLASF
jgi:hypothetical protein